MSIDYFCKTLKNDIDKIANGYATNIINGLVVNVDPVEIRIDAWNISLNEEDGFLVLSPFCYDKYIKIEREFKTEDSLQGQESVSAGNLQHNHEFTTTFKIRLWRGIREGDVVDIIHASDKQKFYIASYHDLEVGEVDDDTSNISF